MNHKPTLSFWQIWNMSFGFLGIQFGWALQMSNMSAIYQYLGAQPDEIPMLWLAAPLTGLLVQPVIGYLSDRTWTGLGRRKPYFLVGAILASICLVFMPNASTVWMAAGLLWILDASINVSMEPFRAFVGDMLPQEQHTQGFSMQSFFIGLGAVVASALPWLMANWFGVKAAEEQAISETVRLSFYLGAAAFIGAVVYTVATTKEYPPTDLAAFEAEKMEKTGLLAGAEEIFGAIAQMPQAMKQISLVQFFTWPGLFLMWFYFTPAVATHIFKAPGPSSPLYTQGVEWAGLCSAFYSLVTFGFAFALPPLAKRLGRKTTHSLCLVVGAVGLISVGLATNKYQLFACMAGVGVAWASILSMPYAMLVRHLPPAKLGIYMGIFNFFIVIPEIIASLGFGWLMKNWLGNSQVTAVMLGGGLLL
ncbi:MAG: MFS transporter, partial [Bernardetiaceae bacterium]|nr:MFS transporter [Bernardetiaceae bacterium]